jgi:hypothetical protein
MNNIEQGLYKKFTVLKDGEEVTFPTFTLRIDGDDPHALVALQAYSNSCRTENPTLADELDLLLNYD